MADEEPIKDSIDVAPEAKLKATEMIMAFLSNNETYMVTGSVALKIAEISDGGAATLKAADMSHINDLDLVTTEPDVERIYLIADTVQGATGFPVNVTRVDLYETVTDPESKGLALSAVDLQFDTKNAGTPRRILHTTPEFNLLSLVEQEPDEHASEEKNKSKVEAIQKHPRFSKEKFKQLARAEIDLRRKEDLRKFEQLKEIASEIPDEESQVQSLYMLAETRYIDGTKLRESVKRPGDLVTLSYENVQTKMKIEKFLEDMEQKEV